MNIRLVFSFIVTISIPCSITSSQLLESDSKRLLVFGPSAKINEILSAVQCIKQFLIDHAEALEHKEWLSINHKLDIIATHIQQQNLSLQQHDTNTFNLYKKLVDRLKIITFAIEKANNNTNNNLTLIRSQLAELAQLATNTKNELLTDFRTTWTTLGSSQNTSIDPALLVNNEAIDNADLNVIQWLKTIYRKVASL